MAIVFDFGKHFKPYEVLSNKKWSNDQMAQELLAHCKLLFDRESIFKGDQREELKIFMNLAFHLGYKDGVAIASYNFHGENKIEKSLQYKDGNFFKFCSMAASFENVHAMQELGLSYEYGLYGEAINLKKAFAEYQKAADLNNNLAKFNLATFYETGKGGVAQDLKKSLQLYQEAFDVGSVEAKTRLAFFHENGLTLNDEVLVSKDEAKALQFYQEAVAENDLAAFFHLGRIYKSTAKEREAAGLLTQFFNLYQARPECDKAIFNLAKKELGQLIAANILPLDVAEKDAQIYYRSLTEFDIPEAKFKLASALLKAKQTSAEGVKMMTELATGKNSVAEAAFILSKFYKDSKDEKKSLQFLERAKNQNYPPALFEWGNILNVEAKASGGKSKLSAEQVVAKKRDAADYFFQAANASFAEANQALGAFIEEKIFPTKVNTKDQEKDFLLQCAKIGIKEAQFVAAELLQDDEELVKEFLRKSAAQNYLPAILLVVKDESNLEEKGKMYKQIAESGNVDGQREYALYLASQEKFGEALPWFDLAAKQKDKLSEEKIVEYLGESIVPNFQYENEVLKFYEKYSHIPKAAFAAVLILEKNINSVKGKSKADAEKKMMLYLNKAAAGKYPEAVAMLQRLSPHKVEEKLPEPVVLEPQPLSLEPQSLKIEMAAGGPKIASENEPKVESAIILSNRDKIIILEQEIAALELANDRVKLGAKKQDLHNTVSLLVPTLNLSSDADFISQRSIDTKFSIAAVLKNNLQHQFDIDIAKYAVNLLQEVSSSSLYEDCKNRTGEIFVLAAKAVETGNHAIAEDVFKFLTTLSTYYKSERADQILKDIFINKAPVFSEIAAKWLFEECVDGGNISAYQNLKTLADNRCDKAATLLAAVPADKRTSAASSAESSRHVSRTSSFSSVQSAKYPFTSDGTSASAALSYGEEMEKFLSNSQEIKSSKDLPLFVQSMFSRLKERNCQFFIKGSAVYRGREKLKRNPVDLDLDIMVNGLYASDDEVIKSFVNNKVLKLSVDDITIYRDQGIITVNVKDAEKKIDVSIYDSARLPLSHLSWTTNIERRISFDDVGMAKVDYPRGLKEYVKSIGREMVLDPEKDFIINPAARGLVTRLCFLEAIGVVEKEKVVDQLKKNPLNPADLLVQEFKIDDAAESKKVIEHVKKFITSHSLEGELRDSFIANLSEMAATDSWSKPQSNPALASKIALVKTVLAEMQKVALPAQEVASSILEGGSATQLKPALSHNLEQ